MTEAKPSAACTGRKAASRAPAPPAASSPGPAWTGAYRCAGCGHGRHLTAWGSATVHGPLGAAGDIEAFDWDEVWQVHEASIQCARHPGGLLEKNIGGRWHRWHRCPLCHGTGQVPSARFWDEPRKCPADGFPDSEQQGRLAHGAWWPAGEILPPSPLEAAGHRFMPGHDLQCRHCGAMLSSNVGRSPCAGEGHCCPAPAAEGDSPAAHKVHGRDGWFCGQPGVMSSDFTIWRCHRGHTVTLVHVPPGADHPHTCPSAALQCPWEFLAARTLTPVPDPARTAGGTS